MFEIHFSNRQSHLPIDEVRIREIVTRTLEAQQVSRAEISVTILDDDAIHVVNREYLEHDFPTDVISFVYSEQGPSGQGNRTVLRGAGLELDGEVLVSAQTAQRVAAEHGWHAQDELLLYVVHGLLHLCGYDDQTAEEQEIMRTREQAVLKIWNLTPHYML